MAGGLMKLVAYGYRDPIYRDSIYIEKESIKDLSKFEYKFEKESTEKESNHLLSIL